MKTRDWFAFIALALAWGSSFLWIKIALEEMGPFLLVAFRLLFGLLGLLVVLAVTRPKWPRDWHTWQVLIVLGMINTAIPFVLISWAEIYIDSAVASILNGSVPLFTTVIAHFFVSDDRMNAAKVLALFTGFAGVVILLMRDLSGGFELNLLGHGAMLLAVLFYAVAAVYARRGTGDIAPVMRALIPVASADAAIWLVTPFVESPITLPQLPITWFALVWLGIIGSCIAYLLYYYLIHAIGPTRATMVTYTFPLIGVVLGVVFLNELLDFNLVLGGALVLASIIIVNSRSE
ncbi:MAG: DMT family transporter [Chloroflexi bacterium]|nr:DMT family transporter [Chloroflexota bacterium]